jgi:GT2 family glycosyltransferase
MLKILIGIPVLDNVEITRTCLQYLEKYTEMERLGLEVSVLIIDNGSQEDIFGLLRNEIEPTSVSLFYLRNPRNLGVAVVWNQILRFSPGIKVDSTFFYDYYVISNNDVVFGPDWLQPLVEAMEADSRIGWVSSVENGSPVAEPLIEAHEISKLNRLDPKKPYSSSIIKENVNRIYEKWDGHDAFCEYIKGLNLPLFMPFERDGRSAVCFMVRPTMIEQIGYFDEDYAPIGIAEDLEYFLRMERILMPSWLTEGRYPESDKWKAGFCGKSIVHHNWCSTRQGPHFDGRKWDKAREKNWKSKFGKSRKYYTTLFP